MAKLKVRKPRGKRCVLYLRKSTGKQETSIDRQRDDCTRYALKHGYEIVGEYIDAGISGVDSAEYRPAFVKMVADASAGKFDIAIGWKLSRFTRSDPMESMAELLPLRNAGCFIATTDRSEPYPWHEFAGILNMSLDSFGSNEYSKAIADGVTSAHIKRAKEGKWPAGRTPKGYVRGKDGRLALGAPADVQLIEFVFESYAKGNSLRQIAHEIHDQGYPHNVSWISGILRNGNYTGDLHFNRTAQGKFKSIKGGEVVDSTRRGQNAQADVMVTPNTHPAIIDQKTWKAVQNRIARNVCFRPPSTPHRNGGKYVLSGLLYCGKCGYRCTGTDHSGTLRYVCGSYNSGRGKKCSCNLVTQDEVLSSIMVSLRDELSEGNIEKARKRIIAASKKQKPVDVSALIKRRDAAQAKLDRASGRLLLVDEKLLESCQRQAQKLRDAVDDIDAKIEAATTSKDDRLQDFADHVDAAIAMLDQLDEAAKYADPALLRELLRRLFAKITINVQRRKAGSRFRYTFTGGEMELNPGIQLSCLSIVE